MADEALEEEEGLLVSELGGNEPLKVNMPLTGGPGSPYIWCPRLQCLVTAYGNRPKATDLAPLHTAGRHVIG